MTEQERIARLEEQVKSMRGDIHNTCDALKHHTASNDSEFSQIRVAHDNLKTGMAALHTQLIELRSEVKFNSWRIAVVVGVLASLPKLVGYLAGLV